MSILLSREQFRETARRGIGRAILHLKHHPEIVYAEEILDTCTHNRTYDTQCEETRTAYLWSLLRVSGQLEAMRKPILFALRASKGCRAFGQVCDLVSRYARQGDSEARSCLYDKHDRNDTEDWFSGSYSIVHLDGIAGLIHMADRQGQEIRSGRAEDFSPEIPYGPRWLDRTVAKARLEEEAADNENIRVFLDSVASAERRKEQRPRRPEVRGLPYQEVKDRFADMEGRLWRFRLRSWAKHATPKDLAMASEDMIAETDPISLKPYLLIFGAAPFPGDPQFLIDLARSQDHETGWRSIHALSFISHDSVRRLFLELLENREHLESVFELLVSNFRAGDEALITHWLAESAPQLKEEPDREQEWVLHSIGIDLLDIFHKHDQADCREPMMWLYESSLCGLCRYGAVNRLIKRGVASWDLLQECRFDSDSDTRNLARRALRERSVNMDGR